MKNLLIRTAVALSVITLAACTNGHEAAPGTPVTDISKTSTESGAHAAGNPYSVLNQQRDGRHLTIDVNVTDLGKAGEIGRQVVNDKKGDEAAHPPERTIEWSAEKGFSATGGTTGR